MRLSNSTSIAAIAVALMAGSHGAFAQAANTTGSDVNVLNLLAPFLNLNATAVGQQMLSANLTQTLAVNNNANAAQQAKAISDKTLPGNVSAAFPTAGTITLADGTKVTLGVGDNLAGGEPLQAIQNSTNAAAPKGTINPIQPVGGYGNILGADYQKGIRASTPTSGPLAATFALLNTAYSSASNNLGVAKNYFANGAASNPSTTPAGYVPVAAVAPAGFTLPKSADGSLPSTANSPYDLAYGVTNKGVGQDVYGDSRPDQVALPKVNSFDPAALDGLATNPSFPSGHTTYAFTESELLGMLTPSLYQSMLARAADYGNDRIVLGVHYALDIIGSRSLASYDLAQEFTNAAYQNGSATGAATTFNLPVLFNAANKELSGYLTTAAATGLPATAGLGATATCGTSVATCATSAANTANDPYVPSAAAQATYRQELNYGMPVFTFDQAPIESAPSTVGGQASPNASILLATVFGGSTDAAKAIAPNGGAVANLASGTIGQIIMNTEGQALQGFYGTALSYWSRIDLYSAAGYFAGTNGTLTMAASDVVNVPVQVGNNNTSLTGNTALFSPNATLYANGATFNGNVNVLGGSTFGGGSATNVATATINGNLTLQSGATYAVTTTAAGQTSSTKVNGAATITGATLGVVGTAPTNPFTQVQVAPLLTATGGVTGTFAGATSSVAGLSAFLNGATLTLDRTDIDFSSVGATGNQVRVGRAIGAASATNTNAAGGQIVNALFNSPHPQSDLDRMSGEGITATQNAALQSSAAFMSSIEDEQNAWRSPTAAAPNGITLANPLPGNAQGYASASQLPFPPLKGPLAAAPRLWRAWGAGFGGETNLDGNAGLGTARQTSDVYGGLVGVDYQAQPNILIGAAAGGTGANFTVGNRATNGTVTGGHGALYATYGGLNGFYVNSSLAFSGFQNEVHRTATAGGLNEAENASFGSFEVRVRGEVGERFGYGPMGITPFAAVEYANLSSDAFHETAAGVGAAGLLSLNVASRTTESLPVFAGVRLDSSYVMGNGNILRPFIQAAYVHEFDPSRNLVNNFVSLPGASFLVEGARPAQNSAQIKTGFDLSLGHGVSLFANFDGEFSGIEDAYAGKGGLRVDF